MKNNSDIRSNLQNTLAKLWELIKNSSDAIVELKDENKSISEQNQFLHNIINEKEDSSINLARKNSELLNKIKNMQYDLVEKDRKIDVLKEEIDDKNANLEKFKDAENLIEEKDRHIDELLLENESLLKEYSQIKTERNKSEIMLEQYEYQNKNMSQAYVELKDELAELKTKLDNINSDIAHKDEEILNLKILENDYDKLKISYNDLTPKISELSELTKNHTQLRHKIEILEKENRLLKIKVAKSEEIKEQLAFLKKDNINKNFIIHEKQKLIDAEKENVANLDKYKFLYNKQKSDLEILHKDFAQFEEEYNELNQKLVKAETEVNVFDAKYDNLAVKYDHIVHQFKKYEENEGEKRALEISKLTEELTSLKEQNEQLANQLAAAKVSSDNFIEEKNATQEQYDKSLAKIEELEYTIKEMKSANNNLSKDFSNKETEINDLKDTVTTLKNEISSLNDIEEESRKLRISIDRLKEEINSLNNELNEKNTKISNLHIKYNELNQKYRKVNLQSESMQNRSEYINDMMKNANEKINKHNKLKSKITELESELESAKNNNTIKNVELEKYRNKSLELEKLVRTRYEQIQILEEQLNSKIEMQNKSKEERLKLAEKLEKYIVKIDNLIEE